MPRPKSDDPKRNAGISLNQSQIDKLEDYRKSAKLDSISEVVSLLISKKLPDLWWDLELKKNLDTLPQCQ